MSGTPLPALPATAAASTVKSRALGHLQHLGLLPERGSDSPVTMSRQEIRTARSKKAGAKRMHNLDITEKAEEHGMYSAEDVHRVMTELKGKVASLEVEIEEFDETQEEVDEELELLKERRKTAEAAAKASEEAKKNYEQKLEPSKKELEGKRKEWEGKTRELEQLAVEIKKKVLQKMEQLDAEMEKKLEGCCSEKEQALAEKEQALTFRLTLEMERIEQMTAIREGMEIREGILARAEARAEEKDVTKLQDKVRKLEQDNAKLAAKLQSKKKRKRSHAQQQHRQKLSTVDNTASTASK